MNMRNSLLALLSALCFIVGGVGCAGPAANVAVDTTTAGVDAAPAFAVDDLETVKASIAAGAIVIDVRPAKFASEKPLGAPNIPFDEIDARIEEINTLVGGDPSTPVVVVCGNGSKAVDVRDHLKTRGFTEVYAQSIGAVEIPAAPTTTP